LPNIAIGAELCARQVLRFCQCVFNMIEHSSITIRMLRRSIIEREPHPQVFCLSMVDAESCAL
jgi:hypothetical protein